ncbi:hypothetical protein [Streptomyces sp. CBMA123]|uniref:hypothetical protein n=1 Tax=Streptomyces sp. CBMA123 TaxID=1896313 RepID=UPI001661E343|nr:hypothetical protein [Streptomyces sp. CBMA123]MBD0689647.1 hypothetical protein [Streptomyces sp. CBMA123]
MALPNLEKWADREVVSPEKMNVQVYDVHQALYDSTTQLQSNVSSLNRDAYRLGQNPVLSLEIKNPFDVPNNVSVAPEWDLTRPAAKVGDWVLDNPRQFTIPEAGVYRARFQFACYVDNVRGAGAGKVRGTVTLPYNYKATQDLVVSGMEDHLRTYCVEVVGHCSKGDKVGTSIICWWADAHVHDTAMISLTIQKIADLPA